MLAGWSLGEGGEWAKHTNMNVATRAPLVLRVPGITDNGMISYSYTEHVDIYPTLATLAAGTKIPQCPRGPTQRDVILCVHGADLSPLLKDPNAAVKTAAFSQYARQQDVNLNISWCNPISGPCNQGYAVVTTLNGTEYRYVRWVPFNNRGTFMPGWAAPNVESELYIRSEDPLETVNRAGEAPLLEIENTLRMVLERLFPRASGTGQSDFA